MTLQRASDRKRPRLFLHGSVKGMIASAERPAVTIIALVQALEVIMSLLHPGVRKNSSSVRY